MNVQSFSIKIPNPPRWMLVVPPVGDCTMPMLGPLVLCGHLKQCGFEAIYRDSSIELFRQASETSGLQGLCATALNPDSGCKNQNCDSSTTDSGKDPIEVLEHAAECLSSVADGVSFSLDDVSISCRIDSRDGLVSALERVQCFEPFFVRQTLWRDLSERNITHVGLSISYSGQLVLAF